MERTRVAQFVDGWIAGWNARDLEGILGHYDEGIVFHSPKAAQIVGRGRVEGKAALRAYWSEALARIGALRFTLDHFGWDETQAELFIVYVAELGGARNRACERLRFAGEQVVDSEGLYGAPAGS